jgi:SulP family sulfate permease
MRLSFSGKGFKEFFVFKDRSFLSNILSGLTVSLAMIPEAIAFAIVAHLSPIIGLETAFMIALVTGLFGGRPGMISGATGALAVVIISLVVTHGAEYLFVAVVMMGLFQLLFGILKFGKFVRMVPHPVMLGFVNGLAIVIFLAQLGQIKTVDRSGVSHWMSGPPLFIMLGLISLTMAIIYLFPKITKSIPSTLVGILSVSLLVSIAGIRTRTVGDLGSISGSLPSFHLPHVPLNIETLTIVLPYALIMAVIGLTESLLTLNLIDLMTDTRGKANRECMAQGAANLVAGFFGGMGGCAMIGQSLINVNNGAIRRVSSVSMALFLLAFILFGVRWISQIPLAALVGVMFVVAEKTFEWGSFRVLNKVPRADALVVVLVTVITVLTDLAVAVLLGIVISALVFAWEQAKSIRAESSIDEKGRKVYRLFGPLFFASITGFQRLFDPLNDPDEVIIDFSRSRVLDHSALEAIDTLGDRYRKSGKRLHMRHLSPDCLEILEKSRDMVEVNLLEDPHYHVAENRLG